MRKKKNLKKLLNLSMLDYTNSTIKVGDYDMPYVRCGIIPHIDYISSYSTPGTYSYTLHTAVAFFEYDQFFDGLYGLWNGIYYGIKEIEDFYIERFRNVRFFIAPDYSKCGDSCEIENQYRQYKSRIVSIWLSHNTHAVVIPLVSCANSTGMKYMLDGMSDCTTVAFNCKGPMGDLKQLAIFKESIKYAVDNLPKLKCIIAYSTSIHRNKVLDIFSYAIQKGIEVQIPENLLHQRHILLGSDNDVCD